MIACERCGIEYPSEIDFHREGTDGPMVCIPCHQSALRAREREKAAGEMQSGGEMGTPVTGPPQGGDVGVEEQL